MKLSILLALALFAPSWAIESPGQFARRLEADKDAADTQMRSFIINKVSQFDTEYGLREVQDCQPCDGEDEEFHSRQLRLIPKLLNNAKKTLRTATNSTRMAPKTANTVTADTFGPFQNMTIADLFGEIQELLGSNPILLPVAVVVTLTVVVPFLILESISLTTGTPILCILGFESSISFGDCRRRLAESSFFDAFPSEKVAEDLLNTTTTDVTLADAAEELTTILNVTDDTMALLGNATIGGILDNIANFAGDRPLAFAASVTTALVVILPFLVLESISLTTGTPILCILGASSSISFGDCRRLQEHGGYGVTEEYSACQRDYLNCHVNNALLVLEEL